MAETVKLDTFKSADVTLDGTVYVPDNVFVSVAAVDVDVSSTVSFEPVSKVTVTLLPGISSSEAVAVILICPPTP